MKSASFFWGIWLANAIGTFTFWRYIPVVSCVISLNALTVFFWTESPRWLASKNRIVECRKAHRLLNGTGEKAELELNKLIQSQTESAGGGIRTLKDLKFVSQREFYLPLFLCILSVLSYYLCGKLVIAVYAVDMIKKMIKDEATVYYTMLILDGITVFSAYVGCFLTKIYKRRALWFTTFSVAITFLLILSLYIYLVKLSICSENVYLTIFLLIGFCVSISCGPLVLCCSWAGELIAYKYKWISIIIVGLWNNILYAVILKVSPLIVELIGMHGMFLFCALSTGFTTFLMYFYLPETKDKTLTEIEEYFRKNKTVEESRRLVA